MKEWSKRNELNSFNSYKGLLYAKWYQAIKDWGNKKITAPLPPIEASLDPIHACNLMCSHCNAHRYLKNDTNKLYRMSDNHIIKLIDFLGTWGVEGVCIGGGGEPTLHTKLRDVLYRCRFKGMDVALVTNGTLLNDSIIEAAIQTCRWIGVSVDAATSETYKIGRKADLFLTTIKNIEKLVNKVREIGTNCDIAYKFLIMDYNQHEILKACQLAKDLGVKDFHARPADFRHQGLGEWQKKESGYNNQLIREQMEQCHSLETEDFRVFTIEHKFDEDFLPRKDFSQCYAAPCCIQLCANGKVYLCPDTRHMEFYELGSHYPDPREILNFWGGEKHYDLVFKTGKEVCNTRCTFAPYCKQCEELFIKNNDPMCWRFI